MGPEIMTSQAKSISIDGISDDDKYYCKDPSRDSGVA